jgi:hypothetical protein
MTPPSSWGAFSLDELDTDCMRDGIHRGSSRDDLKTTLDGRTVREEEEDRVHRLLYGEEGE